MNRPKTLQFWGDKSGRMACTLSLILKSDCKHLVSLVHVSFQTAIDPFQGSIQSHSKYDRHPSAGRVSECQRSSRCFCFDVPGRHGCFGAWIVRRSMSHDPSFGKSHHGCHVCPPEGRTRFFFFVGALFLHPSANELHRMLRNMGSICIL